ncbi:DDB1- and CUL4-associated factor-like 1, partial [Mucuna pruriens]
MAESIGFDGPVLLDEKLREPLSSALVQEVLFRNDASSHVQVKETSTSQPHHQEKIVTNYGHPSTLAATGAATPNLIRIEREAIAAATPITYLPRDLLLLIHEDLLARGLLKTASMLLKEAQLEPYTGEAPPVQLQWPSGRVPGFLSNKLKLNAKDNKDDESEFNTPIILPMKHKLSDSQDIEVLSTSGKRLNCTPSANDHHPNNQEHITLDSLVVEYLKHQHHQCPNPITTLPPLSLLHPHVCPEPKRSHDAPCNVTSHLATREFRSMHGGVYGKRRDRQFAYSRFRPSGLCAHEDLLTCMAFLGDSRSIVVGKNNGELRVKGSSGLRANDGHGYPLTLVQSFISGDRQLLLSSSLKDVKLWDASWLLRDRVWDEYVNEIHLFSGCKAARISNSGSVFAALSSGSGQRQILLYDVQTCQLQSRFSDTSIGNPIYSRIHFSHSDSMLLWNGVLWDPRVSVPVHCFDQITDFGGGGFHPAGNEVIINSEVWDLRKFRVLLSVPSLDQTTITFNGHGDVIYAILRRNIEDVMSTVHTHRLQHPLFAAFLTVDAANYSDIATTEADHCVLDFTTEPTDSFVGLVTMLMNYEDEYEFEDEDDMRSAVRIYEIGSAWMKLDEDYVVDHLTGIKKLV